MIRIIRNNLAARYRPIARLLLADTAIALFLYGFYRARIYGYILSVYPDVLTWSFPAYLSHSLHYDSMTLFWTIAAFFLILLALAGFKRLKYLISAALLQLLVFFLLFSMEFFRVYETTFQKNFAGEEHFSALGNVLDSALAEFSLEFYILLIIFSAAALGTTLFIFRRENREGIHDQPAACSGMPGGMSVALIIPSAAVLSLLIGLGTGPSFNSTDASVPRKNENARTASLMHEFTMNPVYNLFSPAPSGANNRSPLAKNCKGRFFFRLNTDSLASKQSHARLDSIPRPKKYNIILYFFESTPYKYYDLAVDGRPVIETWHRLEKNSINFRRHYANYPLSANALLSALTSAYDLNSTDMTIQKYPDIRLRTLPEILKKRGYRTCLIHTGGLGYAGQKRFLQNRDFDDIIEYKQLIKQQPYNRQVGWGVDERAMIRPAASFISRDPGQPFFLVLLPVNPHHPYAIPDDSFRIAGNAGGDADYRKRNWHNYLNSLHYSDVSLGMLVDELERSGLMEDTLLFLFADHGEAFYQHRMNYNHPLFIYEENVHVPFLVYNKKLFPSPEYFDGVSRHIDILPTVLDVLGIPESPEQEGTSLLSRHREQMALIHTSWKDDYMGIVDRRWKYIRRTSDGTEELYDIYDDPDEKKNIAARHADIANRYRDFVIRAREYRDEYYRNILGGNTRTSKR